VNFLNFLNFLNFSGFLEPFPSEITLGIVHFIGRKRGKCAGFEEKNRPFSTGFLWLLLGVKKVGEKKSDIKNRSAIR